MKKFLSIFLTLCLMLTVVAVPLPAIADTPYSHTFDFTGYNPNDYIEWSGRVQPLVEADGNTVIQFNNNGIPYKSEAIAKMAGQGNSYVKNSDNTYTVFASTDIGAAATDKAAAFNNAIKNDGYKEYYNATAQYKNLTSATTSCINMEAYNAIELVALEPSTEYRITINYKRINLVNDLYVHPTTWDVNANWRNTMTTYNDGARITIKAGSADSEYQTASVVIKTPANIGYCTSNTTSQKGNYLRLVLYTGVVDANNVVYFDNITVEEVTYADVTYKYADDTEKATTNVMVGGALQTLAPNEFGENYGKWYDSKEGTNEISAVPEGGATVYEVVKEGYFDFENHFKPTANSANNNTTASSVRLNLDKDNGKGVMKFENTADTAKNPSTGAITATGNYAGVSGTDRYNSIDIGEVAAEKAATYRITVAVKRCASELPLTLQAWTSARHLNYANSRKTYTGAQVTIPAVAADETEYTEYSFNLTTPANLQDVVDSNTVGVLCNNLFLQVRTGAAGTCVAYIDYVKVEELKGSVTYVIPEGATVNGVTGDKVTVDYYGDDVIDWPTVSYADGYSWKAWTDTETGDAVETPVLNGNYTLVVNEPVEKVTVKFSKGEIIDETLTLSVDKGTEITLPDTKFTETAWWSAKDGDTTNEFVGYEGEKVVVDADVTYYTSEAFAADHAATFRNWSGIDSTGEDSYLYKSVTAKNDTGTWVMNGSSRVCSRIGIVEDNTTYRIDITFKATTSADLGFRFIENVANNSLGTGCSYWENGIDFYTVKADTDLAEWKTVTLYYTTDLGATITASENGLDDTKSGLKNAVYLAINKAATGADVEFALKEVKMTAIDNPVTTKGASVLKDEKVVDGEQAIRYYFDYATDDGTQIYIDGTPYKVVDRGFVYTNGDVSHYTTNGNYNSVQNFKVCYTKSIQGSGVGKLISKTVSGDALRNYWALDNGIMTYSTYVTDISDYNAKMMVRGFVRFTDDEGTIHIVYSKTVNRSVQGIIDALAERHE